MTLQQLWTRGEFVVTPAGHAGMVRAFDRRTNKVAVQMGAAGLLEALHSSIRRASNYRPDDFVEVMREEGIVQDHHFTTLRVGADPNDTDN